MSLEKFRRSRMVILDRRAKVHQAARAMADNHIGAVLISEPPGLAGILTDRDLALAVIGGGLDPATTRLGDVMSEGVITCDIAGELAAVVRLMQQHRVRRIVLTEREAPVGLVTFDDLVLDGSVDAAALRAIVTAQLEVEAPQKPEGTLHPRAPESAVGRTRALLRAKARAEATARRMIAAVAEASGLDRTRAERALLTATCMLCRRLTDNEARDLIAQLPSLLQPRLADCVGGPDRNVTTAAIEGELARTLGLTPEEAGRSLRAVSGVLAQSVSPGQIDEVRGQLPEAMKELFALPA